MQYYVGEDLEVTEKKCFYAKKNVAMDLEIRRFILLKTPTPASTHLKKFLFLNCLFLLVENEKIIQVVYFLLLSAFYMQCAVASIPYRIADMTL